MNSEYREKLFAYKAQARSYEDFMRAFCNRKYNSDFSKEMTRSVREYTKDFDN